MPFNKFQFFFSYSHHTDAASPDEELNNYLLPSHTGNGNEALTSRHAFHPHHSRQEPKLNISSTLNIDLIFWHPQWVVV